LEVATASSFPSSVGQGGRQWTDDALALVLAGGAGSRLGGLTAARTKAAVPFGGRYRAIDFTLSNCVNSQLRRIAVLTQYKSQSLIRHVHSGWGFLHREIGEYIEIWPAQQRDGERWYAGTVDALYQNLDLVEAAEPKHVLVLAGDQIYALDYAELLDEHVAAGADVTVSCVEMPLEAAAEHFGAELRGDRRIERIGPRAVRGAATPASEPALVPMGVYVFDAAFLYARLPEWQRRSTALDLACDLVPASTSDARVFAHLFRSDGCPGYWRDVGTIDRYWRAHMELVEDPVPRVVDDRDWPVFTHHVQLPPAQIRAGARVEAAVVSPGCTVAGSVLRSVLSNGCRVGREALVRDSVLLPGAQVGDGCVLDRVVVDSNCRVPAGTSLGACFGAEQGHYISPHGVMLVTSSPRPSAPHAIRKIA
jgi:glucose-1-phosphate adenylyltransferase